MIARIQRRPQYAPQVISDTRRPLGDAAGFVDMVAAALTTAAVQVMEEGAGRQEVRYYNDGPGVVYIGGQNVSATSGRPIQVGQGWVEDTAPNGAAWACSASTSTLRREIVQ